MARPSGAVSIDADFFTCPDEQSLLPTLLDWLRQRVDAGVPVTVSTDHVDLVASAPHPVDVIVNFDFHMDLSVEFLLGAEPAAPADNSVFETVVAGGGTRRYVWAHPRSRRETAARVYAAATVAGRQPLLASIHCLPAEEAMALVDDLDVRWAFLCRSPDYATPDTDAAFAALARAAGHPDQPP